MTNLQIRIVSMLLEGHSVASNGGNDYRVRDKQHNVVTRMTFKTWYQVRKLCRKNKSGLFVIDKRKVRKLHGNSTIKKSYRKILQQKLSFHG